MDFFSRYKKQDTKYNLSGQSLLEALLSIALGVILIGSSVALMGVSLKTFNSLKQQLQANSLIRQEAEIIQSLAKDNWHSLYDLYPGIHYKLAKQGNAYAIQKGEEKIFDSQGLVSYWSFDEATSTIAYDNQSTNNGTLTNGPTWQSPSNCISGSCLSFDGSNDYVDCGNASAIISNTSNHTVELWVKGSAANSNSQFPISIGNNTLIVGTYNNYITCTRYSNSPSYSSISSKTYNWSTWHYLVFVYNSSFASYDKIYVDGEDVTQQWNNYWVQSTTDKLVLGYDLANSSLRWSGLIDEVRIYNRALSADEVQAHYKAGLDKLGMVSYWALDENGGTTAYDSQSTNNGTLTNGPTWQSPSNCVSGSCLSFDGSDDYVNILNNDSLNPLQITMEIWVKPNAILREDILHKIAADTNNRYGYHMEITASGLFSAWFGTYGPAYNQINSTTVAQAGQWYHVVVTYSNEQAYLFINGRQENYQTFANSYNYISTANLTIGSGFTGNKFNGLIDEVRIYNRALSAEEIAQRYQASYTRYLVTNKVSRTSGNIDTTYNSSYDDPLTLKINSVIKYGGGLVSQQTGGINDLRFYLTRSSSNQIARQNDWSGGSGVLGPSANLGNTYYSSSGILNDYNNKLTNSGFDSIESGYSPGWDVNLNGTYRPASNTPWTTGYNSGVASPSIGYHAHINPTCGIGNSPCFEFIDENCQYNLCHRWLGVAYNLGTPSSLGWSGGRKVTVKLYGKVSDVLKPVSFGLYYYNTAGTVNFHSGRPYLYFSQANTWELKEYVFTLISDIDITKNMSLYIYGHFGTVEGRLWVDNVVVQNGPQLLLASGSSSGELTSSILDTGVTGGAGFNSFLWQGSLGINGSVKLMFAFSNSSSGPWTYYGCTTASQSLCLDSNNWTTSDSSVASFDLDTSYPFPFSSTFQNKRYFRYKVILSTSGTTPQVNDIIINWSP